MDHGWIVTYGSSQKMSVQVSIASEGGSGTPVPDLSIEVDDLDAALQRMKKAKVAIEYGPADEPWGVRRFYVRDPFGRLINILMHTGWPRGGGGGVLLVRGGMDGAGGGVEERVGFCSGKFSNGKNLEACFRERVLSASLQLATGGCSTWPRGMAAFRGKATFGPNVSFGSSFCSFTPDSRLPPEVSGTAI